MKVKFSEQEMKEIATSNKKTSGNMPPKTGILIVFLIITAIFITIIGWKTYQSTTDRGYESPYDLAENLISYTFQGDSEHIFKMLPKSFQTRAIEDNQMSNALVEDDVKTAIANIKKPIDDFIELMNNMHGQWTETHTINQDMYVYTENELSDLKKLLKMQGIDKEFVDEIDEAGIITADVNITATTSSGGWKPTISIPVYKNGKYWYLGLRTGDVFEAHTEGEYDIYGDFLDGFVIVGNFDVDGNPIFYTDEGMMIQIDEDTGLEYYEDQYGNKHFYDKKGHEGGNIKKVIGPDGGEPLTEDTWEEWWDNYYEQQGIDIHPDYQYDEWGNTQYLDEDGNIIKTEGPDGGEPLTEDNYEEYWNNIDQTVSGNESE